MTAIHRDTRRAETQRAERAWREAENSFSRHPAQGFNTAHEVCDRWADQSGRIAVIVRHAPDTTSERWTFHDLARASSRFATALTGLGVRQGDRVGAILDQGMEAHIAALAVWRLGAIFVPLYPGFGSEGLASRLSGSTPAVVIVEPGSERALADALNQADADPVVITTVQQAGGWDRSFWTLIDTHAAESAVVPTAASDTATLIYTSGTTGAPKGCLLPHSYLVTMQPFVRHSYALDASALFASTSGPGWVNGLYSAGACVNADGRPRVIYTGRFHADAWLSILAQEGVTYFSTAPTALRQILARFRGDASMSALSRAMCAGEHQGAALAAAWAQHSSFPLQEAYGTTEIGLTLATAADDPDPQDHGALPRPLPGFEVCLVDHDGNERQERGILAIRNRGYNGCTGYLDEPQKWADRWRGDWYLTGDLAKRDEKGQLWFLGRDDDLIVTSGYNIGPAEVEGAISSHPAVREVAVVAAPDESRGNVVRAIVVPASTVNPAEYDDLTTAIKDRVKRHLGRHVYPRIVEFTDHLPRNQAGKIQRNVLRAQYVPHREDSGPHHQGSETPHVMDTSRRAGQIHRSSG